MKEFNKEFKKLKKRGAIGISIFAPFGNENEIARGATELMRNMKKSKTKSMS